MRPSVRPALGGQSCSLQEWQRREPALDAIVAELAVTGRIRPVRAHLGVSPPS